MTTSRVAGSAEFVRGLRQGARAVRTAPSLAAVSAAVLMATTACAPGAPTSPRVPTKAESPSVQSPPYLTATAPDGGGAGSQVTIAWDVGDSPTGQVFVAVEDGPEKLFAEDRRGVKPVKWDVTRRHEFRLYDGKEHRRQLASVVVEGPRGTPAGTK